MKTVNKHSVEIGRLIARLSFGDIDLLSCGSLVQEQIDCIELDAYKAGMTEAAEIVWKNKVGVRREIDYAINIGLQEIYKEILTARDAKKEIVC